MGDEEELFERAEAFAKAHGCMGTFFWFFAVFSGCFSRSAEVLYFIQNSTEACQVSGVS